MMHIHTPAPSLRATAPERELPERLEALVLTALEKAPDDRFASMEAVAAALDEVLLARPAPSLAVAAPVTTSPVAAVLGAAADATLPGPIGDAGGPVDGSRTMPRLPVGAPAAAPDGRARRRTAPLLVTTALLTGVGLLAIFVAVRLLEQDPSPSATAPTSGSPYTANVQIRQPAPVTSPTESPSPPAREPTVADVPPPVAPTNAPPVGRASAVRLVAPATARDGASSTERRAAFSPIIARCVACSPSSAFIAACAARASSIR